MHSASYIGYAIGDISGDVCKVVSDSSGSIGACDLSYVSNKRTSFASCAFTFESYLCFCFCRI